MPASITFIHGIANKYEPEFLRQLWLSALARADGVDLLAAGASVRMVYWADVLYPDYLPQPLTEAVGDQEGGQDIDSSWRAELGDQETTFIKSLERKLRDARTPEESDATERIPLPWFIKKPLMERLLRDVHHYLFNVRFSPRPGTTYLVRDEIRRRFLENIASQTDRPHIVISHSMGTVIAYDCLKRVTQCPAIDTLFTIGSPLGLDEIQDNLRPEWSRENGFPEKISQWINVFDRLDPVCGADPLLANDYRRLGQDVVEDVNEPNWGWWRHDIEKYLQGQRLRGALRTILFPRIGEEGVSAKQAVDEFPNDFLAAMKATLDHFDFVAASDLCEEIVSILEKRPSKIVVRSAEALLDQLRRKRRFGDLTRLADALITAGCDSPKVRRLYVQGLIDQQKIEAGLKMAQDLAKHLPAGFEKTEAQGLIGRAYKERYLHGGSKANLFDSIDAYRRPWDKGVHADHLWHGINLVALHCRAARDGIQLEATEDYRRIAQEILCIVQNKQAAIDQEADDKSDLPYWDSATAMEACIALYRPEEALRWAREYVSSPGVDAFELASTLRQLEVIWKLDKQQPPGDLLIPLLQAELLKRQGGHLELDPKLLHSPKTKQMSAEGTLEKVFGRDCYKTWRVLEKGLDRCRGVARIEDSNGTPYGTGFLVDSADFNSNWERETLLLTNSHVVSAKGSAISPERVVVDFEANGNFRSRLVGIVASSPQNQLDFSLLRLERVPPNVEPPEISRIAPDPTAGQKLYAIGYPLGATLSVSLQDDLLIDFIAPKLHYRTPTDPGSSGSPIFDEDWRLVALHHAGDEKLPKLSGLGVHAANEGIWIKSIIDSLGNSGETIEVTSPWSPSPLPKAPTPTASFQKTRPTTRSEKPTMSAAGNASQLRNYASSIMSRDRLESVSVEWPMIESFAMESMAPQRAEPTLEEASSAINKLKTNQPLTNAEAFAMEAIVLPRERPVEFIRNNTFGTPESPWEHFARPQIRARVEAALPSIGRVELPGNLTIPYGGTAFVVGPNLLMTNHHVADLFAEGIGKTVRFRSGQSAAWDFVREDGVANEESTILDVKRIVMIHPYWDMALLEVAALTSAQKPLSLASVDPRQIEGDEVAVVGYPAKDWRNDLELQDRIFKSVYNVKRLMPGKLRTRELIPSFGFQVNAITHDSSSLGGASGSAIIHVETGNVVALHFAGIYLKANYAVPIYELARDPRVAELGVNFVGDRAPADPVVTDAWRRVQPEAVSADSISVAAPRTISGAVTITLGNTKVDVPLSLSATSGVAGSEMPFDFTEGMKKPFVAPRLDEREGYDSTFLGLPDDEEAPLPELTKKGKKLVSLLEDEDHILRYHKFSVCMHKVRRLALFTAANVDWRRHKRLIDGRKPTRKELNGFTSDASEKWVTDERIPQNHQLPDEFFTKDGSAFDKGHLTRRDDVTWGDSFADMQMSNGDTFHTTNCSPQTSAFNQSARGKDNWGDLENLIQSESDKERAIVLSGPVLSPDDLTFEGVDERGVVRVQIPSSFWKIVVVRGRSGAPETYGFLLEQDLEDVPLEFAVPDKWRSKMVPIKTIEKLLFGAATLEWHIKYDQFDEDGGERERRRRRR